MGVTWPSASMAFRARQRLAYPWAARSTKRRSNGLPIRQRRGATMSCRRSRCGSPVPRASDARRPEGSFSCRGVRAAREHPVRQDDTSNSGSCPAQGMGALCRMQRQLHHGLLRLHRHAVLHEPVVRDLRGLTGRVRHLAAAVELDHDHASSFRPSMRSRIPPRSTLPSPSAQ